jgi:Winged helix-turn-helix domain (DUF2582)
MLEQTRSSEAVSPLSTVDFERLLRRSALNSRLLRFGKRSNGGGFLPVDFSPIGETAGAIWQSLSDDGPTNFAILMEDLSVPDGLFFMAMGWLTREGKVEFEPRDGDYVIRSK